MIEKISLLPLLASASALACAASTKCIPDVYAKRFTLVKGNADAAMVQEYSTLGCYEIKVDSIVRRSVSPESIAVPKDWRIATNSTSGSPAVTIHASYTAPKLDSVALAKCSKIRTIRRIDSIPRSSRPFVLEGSDLSGELPVAVHPDSVYVCLNGSCSKIVPRVVDNAVPSDKCLEGVNSPFASAEDAFQYLKGRIKAASSVSRLRQPPPIMIDYIIDCPIVVYDKAARQASLVPVYVKETRLAWTDRNAWNLPALRDWTDSTISKRLALPSSANAGDFYQHETIHFIRTSLGATDKASTFRYATGVERYLYRGDLRALAYCPDDVIDRPEPATIGDTLLLTGTSLSLSTLDPDCSVPGVDVHAGKHMEWLFAPSSEATAQQDFFHGANAETQYSWPIANDSVLVGGQKVPVARLAAFVSTLPRAEERRFSARFADGTLHITLEEASQVRVSTPDGRILSVVEAPMGASHVALPRGHRGILVVTAGNRTVRVPAP